MDSALNWPIIFSKLLLKNNLEKVESRWAMREIMAGNATEAQVGAFLIALRSKGETVQELAGLVDVMLQNSVTLNTGPDALDIVGTGGDLHGTVNISSMASILAAGAGIPVMKHGSRSASGKTGSSEMLEALGIRLDLSPERLAEVFRECGITFFFAPVFHPAMRHVAPIRKELGVPTTFNFLGPLANPAQPIATSLGVANLFIAPLLAAEMAARGRTALVFRGQDGLDELTTTGTSQIWHVSEGVVREYVLDPVKLGLPKVQIESLFGGDAQENAQVTNALFNGDRSGNLEAIKDVVVLNAAGGMVAYELAKDATQADIDLDYRFEGAIARINTALESGAAKAKLAEWVEVTQL